jgi:outer membrane lipopolysaccharide assembly protein LptE/RlpB
MRKLLKLITLGTTAALFTACTFGDKGSDKVPDSVSIDTNMHGGGAEGGYTGTGVRDSAVNTGRGTISKDTTGTDSIPRH